MNFIEFKKFLILNEKEISQIYNNETINELYFDLEKINESDNLSLIKLYYIYKKGIHKILYNFKKIIKIKYDEVNNISYYFYLSLLIRDKTDIINYSYSIDFINKINNILKNNKDIYKKVILSKIVIELIDNYKGLIEYYYNTKEIEKIENDNLKIIKDNIYILKELGINLNDEEIKIKKIDEIYTEIIIALLKNDKLENYEYSYDIIKQLDLELIDITEFMFDGIQKFFDTNEKNLRKYLIYKDENLYDIKNINYYFILFKYILKNKKFINNIKFIKENKKLINDLNLNTSYLNIKIIDKNIKERLLYILEIINNLDKNIFKIEKSNIFDKSMSEREFFAPIIINNENPKAKEYNNILIYNKIIGIHVENTQKEEKEKIKKTAEFITEINDHYISGGTDNALIIYDRSYTEIKRIIKNDWIYNIFEYKNNVKNSYLSFGGCSKEEIYFFKLTSDYKLEKTDEKIIIQNNFSIYLINIPNPNNNFVLCCENNITFLTDIFSIIITKENIFFKDKLIKSGIKINNEILAWKSNKIVSKGKDELIFFNYINKNENDILIIKNYSFVFTINGLTVISSEKEKKKKKYKNKVLLCACKKYMKNQKNGILLINIKENENKEIEIKHIFYDTGNFEVYSFCEIFKIKTVINRNIINTNYFLVGGFDNNKNKGIIKLYKIIFGIEYKLNKIEYIQDIMINNKDFKGFKGPITCIIQSKINEKILVSCWDGNDYLFDKPNIEDYLEYDKKVEEKIAFNKFFISKKK